MAAALRGMHDYETAAQIIRTCLGLKPGMLMDAETRRRLSDHIADLIEPPLQCQHYHSDRHYCSVHEDMTAVDRESLLALAEGLECRADELIRAAHHARFSGLGPTMDRAKHDASELRGIARRIREVCGEAGE